ncbi:MAG: M48 family metallopeptidase [Pseudomonadota bacterium]
MDFFAAQDQARRYSRWLILWFLLAVSALIVLTNLLVAALVFFLSAAGRDYDRPIQGVVQALSWEFFGFVCVAVLATVFVVVLFKWAQLSAGGKAVAERLGGQRILPQTDDPAQRRCLNVVEEMALAAGLPVPPVYVLPDERGINAFAAGVSPGDAVIGVTQGSLDHFNREQLQGVIAHEFSHILNGDMRLNIRLAAMVKGITFIGDVGQVIVRGGSRNRYHSMSSRNSTGSGNRLPAQVMAIGVGLWLLGWLGGLFGALIKAAVSRQREFLADASAVQFTRNPDSVAAALKVIGGHPPGATVVEPRAGELSHIFFGQINALWQLARTHPPLPERIRRVEPGWDGSYITADREANYRGTSLDQQRRTEQEQARQRAVSVTAAVVAGTVLGGAAYDAAGADVPDHADAGFREYLSDIPDDLSEQAHDPFGAHAIALGLLLADENDIREKQFAIIETTDIKGLMTTTRQLHPRIAALAADLRLALLELSLPALKCMSASQYGRFKNTLLQVARADQQIDLYEWCLYQVLRHYLDPEFTQVKPHRPRFRKVVQVKKPLTTVMSVLAWHGHSDEEDVQGAFTRGVESLALYTLALKPLEECSVAEFSKAVNELADCYPLLKPRLLKAMALCAAHDDKLDPREVEILVAVAAVMDCPVPASIRSAPAASLA